MRIREQVDSYSSAENTLSANDQEDTMYSVDINKSVDRNAVKEAQELLMEQEFLDTEMMQRSYHQPKISFRDDQKGDFARQFMARADLKRSIVEPATVDPMLLSPHLAKLNKTI